MPAYIAPYPISTEQPDVPLAGTFTVPVCTTPERFKKIMDALWYGGLVTGQTGDYDHLWDWLDACTRIYEGCESREAVCRQIGLDSPRLTWYPESPYTPGEEIPDGYSYHPWTVVDDSILGTLIGIWGLGYKVGDIYTDLTKFPVFTSWESFLTDYGNLPRFTIHDLEGSGTVKLHLLNIPQGGRLIVVRDGVVDLLNLGGIELDKDLTSYPQESQTVLIVPIEIEGEGTHTLDFIFTPVVDAAFFPIFFGGGLRNIELCGFSEVDMPEEACCDETNDLLTTNNGLLSDILKLLQGGFKLVPIGLAVDTLVTSPCAPLKYDSDPDDTGDDIAKRELALCYVTNLYVPSVLSLALAGMGVPYAILDLYFGVLTSAPDALRRLEISYPSVVTVAALLQDFATSGADMEVVVCQMLDALRGQANSFATFRDSVPVDELSEGLLLPLSQLVHAANGNRENWNLFNEALVAAMDSDLSAFTCPCESPVEPMPIDLVDPATPEFHNTVITYLGDNQYKFVQNTEFPTGTWSINIQQSSCLKLNFVTGSGTAVNHWYDRGSDCTTVVADGTGGFAGETYQLGLDCDSPIDITFTILLA